MYIKIGLFLFLSFEPWNERDSKFKSTVYTSLMRNKVKDKEQI